MNYKLLLTRLVKFVDPSDFSSAGMIEIDVPFVEYRKVINDNIFLFFLI